MLETSAILKVSIFGKVIIAALESLISGRFKQLVWQTVGPTTFYK
jgi:hypothetical protein